MPNLIASEDINNSINDLNATDINESSYIDSTHKYISEKVLNTSSYLDDTLSGYLEDDNATQESEPTDEEILDEKTNEADAFFQSEKYLEETKETFVRVSLEAFFQSLDDEEYKANFNAQIPLSKSQKNLNLFIDNLTEDAADNLYPKDVNDEEDAVEVGVSYFSPEYYGIQPKFAVGTQGVNPFAYARFSMEFFVGAWRIEPIQNFRYSVKNVFEEKTSLYFDTIPVEDTLFRIYFQRGTETFKDGMDYRGSLQFFIATTKRTGISFTQSAIGNTKYPALDKTTTPPSIERYSGIHNYVTTISYRQNIFRDWFFYEIAPGVSHHKRFDYDPNYTLAFKIDLYFGSNVER